MIVVSILARDVQQMSLSARAQAQFADVLELRLDHVGDPGEEVLRTLIATLGKPVIAAVNGADAFGHFAGTRAERFAILDSAARAGATFVDVDWREAPHQPPLSNPSCRRIVSRHVLDETPADLARAFAELENAARPNDRLKFVTHARSGEDGVRLLEFVRNVKRDVVGFASGEVGSFTRVLAPIFGSAFTYAAPALVAGAPAGAATAPGQIRADALRSMLPQSGPTRATAVYALLGKPARHSLSPRLHNAVFRDRDRDAVYVAIEPDDVTEFLRLCRAPNWRGFSITAPFKEPAFAFANKTDELSRACRASNTLVRDETGWRATNTDAGAVQSVLRDGLARAKVEPTQAHLVVLGTGGAARAAIVAARALSVAKISVAGRDLAKTNALARELGCDAISVEALAEARFDALVHCTPQGSKTQPNALAISERALRRGLVVVEAVYRPARTPLVEAADRAGAITVLGTEWFARQALLQAECFNVGGGSPAVLQAELARALEEEDR